MKNKKLKSFVIIFDLAFCLLLVVGCFNNCKQPSKPGAIKRNFDEGVFDVKVRPILFENTVAFLCPVEKEET